MAATNLLNNFPDDFSDFPDEDWVQELGYSLPAWSDGEDFPPENWEEDPNPLDLR